MSEPPPLFISHSSRQDPVQTELLALIRQEFGSKLEILLDQDLLRGGDDWRHEIHTWMGLCRAGIVLFSEGVIQNPKWVRKEAAILEWRESLARFQAARSNIEPDRIFLLLPVLLPGFPREKLQELDLSPLDLTRLQLIEGDSATAILDQLRPRLQSLLLETEIAPPLRGLARAIESRLASKNVTREDCLEAARTVGGVAAVIGAADHHRVLARAMIHADLDKVARVLLKLSLALGKPNVLEIFDLLSAFWIDPEAAAKLAEVAMQPPARRAAAINGSLTDTGRYYIRRAYCNFPPGCPTFELNNSFHSDPAAEARSQLREQFRAKLMGQPDQVIERQLDRYCGANATEPFFLLLRGDVRAQTLAQLQQALPGSTFVLLSPESFEHRDEYAQNPVCFIEPELEEQMELWFTDIKSDIQLQVPG